MSIFGGPPPGVLPERLFRLLIGRPRPVLPIAYRFPGISVPLSVRGLRGAELHEATDAAGDLDVEAIRSDATAAGIIAASLLAQGEPVFASAGDVLDLDESTFYGVRNAVLDALGIVSPIYSVSPHGLWLERLAKGAQHSSNHATASAMVSAHDVLLGAKAFFIERPHQFFGMPLADLTDGQLMAFRAARKDLK